MSARRRLRPRRACAGASDGASEPRAAASPSHAAGVELQEGDLLTVAEALRLVPISKSLFYELAAEGTVPTVRVRSCGSRRGRVLVDRAGLVAYVQSLRTPTPRTATRLDVDAIRARVLGDDR